MTERALPVTILDPAWTDPDLLDHSLSLRFDLGQFDPRITFTRNSSATYFGSDGLLKTAAANEPRIDHDPVTGECKGLLIEEQRTNLLVRSEEFDTGWSTNNSSVTSNIVIAPSGTQVGDALIENTATGAHNIFWSASYVAGTTYTLSVYAKEFSSAAKRFLSLVLSSSAFGANNAIVFDLALGTVTAGSGGTIQNVGNGWYRCTLTATATVTGAANAAFFRLTNVGTSGLTSYTGDGFSGIYIWGAQLEVGTFPTSYIPTPATFTSRNSTGTYFDSTGVMKTAAINEPRYDHGYVNGQWVSKGLVLEGASTNLLTYSEQFNNAAWVKANVSVAPNAATAPNGTLSAAKVTESATTAVHEVYQATSVAANTAVTVSAFFKAAERPRVRMAGYLSANWSVFPQAVFDLVGGVVVSGAGVIENIGGGWFKCSISGVTSASGTVNVGILFGPTLAEGTTNNYTGDGTSGIYVWGAQLEAGIKPTSYIKTEATTITRAADLSTSSAVTRAADSAVIAGTNFSSWYRQDEGTLFAEAGSFAGSDLDNSSAAVGDGGSGNFMHVAISNVAALNRIGGGITTGSASQLVGANTANNSYLQDGSFYKAALAYKTNDAAWACSVGPSFVSDATVALPSGMNRLVIGGYYAELIRLLNGHIKRLAYYPKRLTNAKLQALTQ